MRLNITALGLTIGILWGAAILIVALANLVWPSYGRAFLDLLASVYPGYRPGAGVASVITGTLYGLVDGAIGGAVFGWLYNLLAQRRPHT
ncbi:MAG: bacteriophage holin [Vicinamibacterales bacterium]